jgi:hypothetical protein
MGILGANYKRLFVSVDDLSHSECAVGAPIGTWDTNQSSEDWLSGYHIVLISGNQIDIPLGARSI